MNNELAKTISTCAIWACVACILTFGIFRMNVNGDGIVFMVVFCLPVAIVGAAVLATTTIWRSPPRSQTPPPIPESGRPPIGS